MRTSELSRYVFPPANAPLLDAWQRVQDAREQLFARPAEPGQRVPAVGEPRRDARGRSVPVAVESATLVTAAGCDELGGAGQGT